MEIILFFIVVFLANIIQGVTGFAGTILAMPVSLILVGYNTAVPVLNMLGLLSGIYVFVLNRREVRRKELVKILIVMAPMIFVGMWLKKYFESYDKAIYIFLGVLVLILAVTGIYRLYSEGKKKVSAVSFDEAGNNGFFFKLYEFSLLVASGIVHGMFVCGGPLLIGYLTKRIKETGAFRATISTVWIVLNGIILILHISEGLWTRETVITGGLSAVFLFAGMFAGGILYKKMSRRAFMILTYILLAVSGVTLLLK